MRFSKWVGAFAIMIAVSLTVTSAYASHVFSDVDDDRFFAEPVEWALENGITQGCGDGRFCPDDPVTRGENLTFAKRYDDNIVQPGFAALTASIEDLVRVDGSREETDINNWTGGTAPTDHTIVAPDDGYLSINYVVTMSTDAQSTATGTLGIVGGLNINGTEVATTVSGVDFDQPRQANFRTVSIAHIEPVAAGEHDIRAFVERSAALPTGGLLHVYDQALTVLFIPFDGDGLRPSP